MPFVLTRPQQPWNAVVIPLTEDCQFGGVAVCWSGLGLTVLKAPYELLDQAVCPRCSGEKLHKTQQGQFRCVRCNAEVPLRGLWLAETLTEQGGRVHVGQLPTWAQPPELR